MEQKQEHDTDKSNMNEPNTGGNKSTRFDKMREWAAKSDVEKEALRPRPGFLWAAMVFAMMSVAAYFAQDQFVSDADEGITAFAMMVAGLVLIAVFCVFCYRNPRLGNKFLGYDGVLDKDGSKQGGMAGYHYSGGFREETGVAVKRQNSRRKEARHLRKKMAAQTREMTSDTEGKTASEPVSSHNQSDDKKA